ncbi:class I SAM-dependent methyltransferase [Neosynechococcus sphagnicola]|uniref:class I SAM-dependent methyltransferase n=1 Tax=Neosynechococcus sphagnicola TaxID=1501145 RepID=UPI00195548FA|nr:class I SAM-dependent methyltransferase [Neosynechococcus sphagnicola]
MDQTQTILAEMPILFQDWGISSILDIPCGDFYWMSKLQLEGIRYIGADIVKQIIEINQKKQTDNITFIQADLLTDNLPQVDLIFCRDCLVHFSFADIHRALKNICKSNSKFLLTTTFPERDHNYDIVTGEWRVLNLEIEPFGLPAPARMLVEGCTEENGIFKDKSLGLWRISDIQQCLKTS